MTNNNENSRNLYYVVTTMGSVSVYADNEAQAEIKALDRVRDLGEPAVLSVSEYWHTRCNATDNNDNDKPQSETMTDRDAHLQKSFDDIVTEVCIADIPTARLVAMLAESCQSGRFVSADMRRHATEILRRMGDRGLYTPIGS